MFEPVESKFFTFFSFFFRGHSDDPLISGAIDDNQNEFDAIANCNPISISSPTICTNYKKPMRSRKKDQVKLRFHHQALPQEYLDHYEATQIHLIGKDLNINSTKEKNKSYDDIAHMQERKIHDSMQLWLQKVTEIHEDKAAEERIATRNKPDCSANTVLKKKPNRIVSYNDLPYMGEMTLENSKPRRGRKPKKADICHLIYKNYGTIFPDQPLKSVANNDEECLPETRKTKIQNKLKSSLLENRLTQHQNTNNKNKNNRIKTIRNLEGIAHTKSEEPLNLCVRDIYEGGIQIISSEDTYDCMMESKSDVSASASPNPLFSTDLKMALPNFQPAMLETKISSPVAAVDFSETCGSSSNWLSSNAFMHPMALYLHKMADTSKILHSDTTPLYEAPKKADQASLLAPKKLTNLVKAEASIVCSDSSSANVCEPNIPSSNNTRTKVSNSSVTATVAPKRKRSAIFIPPVPEESSTNHATEVSICKFKFTGGAKPSLQEKKMLSVDAGGNFRYYSGTGDKSIRGYEFFPRESLQQSSLMACSSAGAFLNTPGKRISTDINPPSLGLSNELLHLPADIITGSCTSQQSPIGQCRTLHPNGLSANNQIIAVNDNNNRKRRSKRSMQREKLEKTFKEKGFLIQTQQLQSAEGATYCKFRQLRKFTRYLFRSWKDYLPGELQQSSLPFTGSIDTTVIDNDMHIEQQPSTSTLLPSFSNAQSSK